MQNEVTGDMCYSFLVYGGALMQELNVEGEPFWCVGFTFPAARGKLKVPSHDFLRRRYESVNINSACENECRQGSLVTRNAMLLLNDVKTNLAP